MRKSFAVKKIVSDRLQAISFSLDATRPEEYFASLERDLGKLGVGGEVLLDLLACNGATSRRFVVVTFDGSHFDRRTMHIKSGAELGEDVVAYCADYYSKRLSKLDATVLSPATKHKLARRQTAGA
jgi:hypothetical protein